MSGSLIPFSLAMQNTPLWVMLLLKCQECRPITCQVLIKFRRKLSKQGVENYFLRLSGLNISV